MQEKKTTGAPASAGAKAGQAKPAPEAKKEAPVQDGQLVSGVWSNEPEKVITRVFRNEKYTGGIPSKANYATAMRRAGSSEGVAIEPLAITITQNRACQYVLLEGAIEYATQLKALRKLQKAGFVREVNPKFLHKLWVPEPVKRKQHLQAELKKAQAELDAL
jgi:hypothetical protein